MLENCRRTPIGVLSDPLKGLYFNITTHEDLEPVVVTDPIRLRKIVLNLIGNAVKFTDVGGVLTSVSTYEESGELRLRVDVIDTGPGMTAEQASTLFAPFTQADSCARRRYGGTGLGLAISRRLSSMLGGDVTLVESTLGQGARFRAELRVTRPTGTSANLPAGHSSDRNLGQPSGLSPRGDGPTVVGPVPTRSSAT